MSRKDGLPKNAELLADFRCASHQVLVNAYERQLGGERLSPWLEEKPLAALFLTVGTHQVEPALGRVSVLSEMLSIQPLDSRVGIIIEAHPRYKKYPEDIKERYQNIATAVAGIALSRGLSVASALPMEAVNADYVANMSNNTRIDAGVFEPKQNKFELAAAKLFAEEALEYVRSDDFMEQTSARLYHHFGLEISPNLPLNGYEPRQFLVDFRVGMINKYNECLPFIQAEDTDDEGQMLVEAIRAYAKKCARAAEKAQEILDSRNDYDE